MEIERDNEGYLLDPELWTRDIAKEIAVEENIDLNEEHWMVIEFVRDSFEDKQSVPQARTLLKHMKQTMGDDRSSRRYLYSLFPYGYGQQACKIAGMRKPLKLMLDV